MEEERKEKETKDIFTVHLINTKYKLSIITALYIKFSKLMKVI